jgi:hypothetical protein
MSSLNIAKFCRFVIFAGLGTMHFVSCSTYAPKPTATETASAYSKASTVGKLEDSEITESSGIAASKCQANVFWTHNDSGDEAFIFAIGPTGEKLGTWRVPAATNYDWEDIAATRESDGKCYVYIGDIGDNGTKRDDYVIYKLAEPQATTATAQSSKRSPVETERPETIRYTYPDGKHNAETLLVDQRSGTFYIVTKRYSGPARLFKLRKGSNIAEKLGEIALPAVPNGSVTGGDISPNGDRVVLCDYSAIYEYVLPKAGSVDAFFSISPTVQRAGDRNIGEAITYSPDGTSLYLTSEGTNSPVIKLSKKN